MGAPVKPWREVLLPPSTAIRETIRRIDDSSLQIALIVDAGQRLLGTVTDGDVRRGLLKGVSLSDPVSLIMNAHPTVAKLDQGRDAILGLMKSRLLHHIPVVDDAGKVVGLEILEELVAPSRENWVILMAGGLGSRLRPLTDDTPKPLLKVGQKPIIENIIENFVEHGFRRFFLSVNYKAGMFKDYFGDGTRFGVEIDYLDEKKRMGTAGALSLLPGKPDRTMVVMNADLLTKVSFSNFLDFHIAQNSVATMGVREYEFQVPYGVVRLEGQRILGIDEKPSQKFFVNAGIYALEPKALQFIPADSPFDMPALFESVIEAGQETAAFPIREYWLDVGRLDDYERAHSEFQGVFG